MDTDHSGTDVGFDPRDSDQAANPQPLYKMLRESTPVMRGDFGVVLTRREDIDWALRHPEVFSSNMSAVNLGQVRPLIPLQIDPPQHVTYRRVLDPLFTPRRVAHLEPDVIELVEKLVGAFIDRGECDLHAEFSVPLPCTVFLRLLGLPLEELDLFLELKDGIIRPPGTMQEQAEVRSRTAQRIYDHFDQALAARATDRRDDLLSRFLDTEIDGKRLTHEEILDICFLFLIAGLDTVTDSLDCFFAFLAQHEDHRRLLVGDETLIPSAVEELLRWETPVPGVARIAIQDAEVSGCPIKTGESVSVLLGSANTDECEFSDADAVDFNREPNRHLAFGGGVHRCLGSHLARLELRVSLREFHRRIPEYSLAPGARLQYTPGLRSVEHLPLVFGAPASG